MLLSNLEVRIESEMPRFFSEMLAGKCAARMGLEVFLEGRGFVGVSERNRRIYVPGAGFSG